MRVFYLSLVAVLLLWITAAGTSNAAGQTIELIFEKSEGVILEGRVGEEPLNFLVEVYSGLKMSVSIDGEAGAQSASAPGKPQTGTQPSGLDRPACAVLMS